MDYILFMTNSLTTASIKDVYQKELLKILNSCKGPKAIYWERRAIAPVNLVIGSVLLKVNEINLKKMALILY